MRSQLERDLGRHLQQQIGELLQRQIAAAQQVLSPVETSFILVEAAVSMSLSAIATVASVAQNPAAAGELFDSTAALVASSIASDRDRALATIAERSSAAVR